MGSRIFQENPCKVQSWFALKHQPCSFMGNIPFDWTQAKMTHLPAEFYLLKMLNSFCSQDWESQDSPYLSKQHRMVASPSWHQKIRLFTQSSVAKPSQPSTNTRCTDTWPCPTPCTRESQQRWEIPSPVGTAIHDYVQYALKAQSDSKATTARWASAANLSSPKIVVIQQWFFIGTATYHCASVFSLQNV